MTSAKHPRRNTPPKIETMLGTCIPTLRLSLPMQMMRTREAIMKLFRPTLHKHGLTDQSWRIFRALAEQEFVEPTQISRLCEIQPASVTRILQRLQEEGQIRRTAHPADLRSFQVSFTPRGRRLFECVLLEIDVIYADVLRNVGSERIQRLHGLLEQLHDELQDDA